MEDKIIKLLTYQDIVGDTMTFIEAYPKQREGVLMWFPVAIAEFNECRTRGERLVIECYLSHVLKNPLLRFLTIRRLDKNTKVLTYPTIEVVKLKHEGCSEYELLRDAEKVESILSDSEEARKFFSDLISRPEDSERGKSRRWWAPTLFRPPRIDTQEVLLRSNIAILKEILANLCLDRRIKPSSWTPSYILLRLDVNAGRVSIVERDREETSNIYSKLMMRDEIRNSIGR